MGRMVSLRLSLFIVLIILDIYIFFVLKNITQNFSSIARNTILAVHVTLALITFLLLFNFQNLNEHLRNYVFSFLIAIIFAKIIISVFFLIDDIRRLLMWSGKKIISGNEGVKISRSAFLSWLGLILGTTFLGTIFYGFTNKYDYRISRVKMKFPNLPSSFKGLKILQISDVHSGSFDNKKAVERGIDMIMQQKADIILFTGDLVNGTTPEMNDYKDLFSRLQAPMGVYSVLGNHDYGDYHHWDSQQEKAQNLENLKSLQKEMGWKLMMNEHTVFERNGEQIALLGIENWGTGRFPKYGKLKDAYAGTQHIPFKILMSHDPSHWDAQVNKEFKDIDLTLSGHTHGMQFGVYTPKFKWSPVQYVYKQWAGKYEKGKQVLYVNRGFGFIGYNGRVGILPEITVIELI